MKQILIVMLCLLSVALKAQTPENISYQAVIRNADGGIIINKEIAIQLSIISGSQFGPSVFVERHMANTNSNGLVSIELGNGEPIHGAYEDIAWKNGPFFIKSETDITGGTSYSLSTITEIHAVPYALHSVLADSVIGGLVESDPLFSTSIASNISSGDTALWNSVKSIPNIDSSKVASWGFLTAAPNELQAGNGLSIENGIISLTQDTSIRTYEIGELAFGGIVFWVDETSMHGLVCSLNDLGNPDGNQFYYENEANNVRQEYNSPSEETGSGKYNTSLLQTQQRELVQPTVVDLALGFSVDGEYNASSWYLPSRNELNRIEDHLSSLNQALDLVGGDVFNGTYWSSTTYPDSYTLQIPKFYTKCLFTQKVAPVPCESNAIWSEEMKVRVIREF